MKIGYPCINTQIGCTANSTFRLKNYSEDNLIEKVTNNLECLKKILEYNAKKGFLFFRISSDLIPFASHQICKYDWGKHFKKDFIDLGKFIKKNEIRISMHPDQFVLINSPKIDILKRSIADLKWHCEVLDLMKLDYTAKVQIHVGGGYGDKESSMKRFIENYNNLPTTIKRRLAIENDERLFSLQHCLFISKNTGIPIIFDSFHHTCLNNGEKMANALRLAQETWKKKDGILMTDYSSQAPKSKIGKHIGHIDKYDFISYIKSAKGIDLDIMLEIKDKERSAKEALRIIKNERPN